MLVWAVKKLEIQRASQKVVIQPGQAFQIQLRSELVKLTKDRAITRDRGVARKAQQAARAGGKLDEAAVDPAFRTPKGEPPEVTAAIDTIAVRCGFPKAGARAQYAAALKKLGGPGTAPEKVAEAVLRKHKAWPLEASIREFAEQVGEDPVEVEAAVQATMAKHDVTGDVVLQWFRFAAEMDGGRDVVSVPNVCSRIAELTAHGVMTMDDAMALVREEVEAKELKPAAEARGELANGSRVTVAETTHPLYGLSGLVLKVQTNKKCQVKLDADPEAKKWRVLHRDLLELEKKG